MRRARNVGLRLLQSRDVVGSVFETATVRDDPLEPLVGVARHQNFPDCVLCSLSIFTQTIKERVRWTQPKSSVISSTTLTSTTCPTDGWATGDDNSELGFDYRAKDGNVARHTMERLNSFVDGVAGKRLTYKSLIA